MQCCKYSTAVWLPGGAVAVVVVVEVGVVDVVVVVVDVDVVGDWPWSSNRRSSTLDAPRSVVFADAAITSGLVCMSNTPLDDLPQVLSMQINII